MSRHAQSKRMLGCGEKAGYARTSEKMLDVKEVLFVLASILLFFWP